MPTDTFICIRITTREMLRKIWSNGSTVDTTDLNLAIKFKTLAEATDFITGKGLSADYIGGRPSDR